MKNLFSCEGLHTLSHQICSPLALHKGQILLNRVQNRTVWWQVEKVNTVIAPYNVLNLSIIMYVEVVKLNINVVLMYVGKKTLNKLDKSLFGV